MKCFGSGRKKTAALVLAAGQGKRFGGDVPKQFLPLDEQPMFLYCIDALLPKTDRLFLVTSEEEEERALRLLEEAGLASDVRVITGGKDRYDSSMAGLRALREEGGFDFVLIHDAARALLQEDVVDRVIEGAEKYGAVIAAIPSKDTVKFAEADGTVTETPDRRHCYQVQTPQAFRTDWIEEAYRNAEASGGLSSLTDDASAVERFTDHKVHVVSGSEDNFKITTPYDFMIAEAVLTARRLRRESETRETEKPVRRQQETERL